MAFNAAFTAIKTYAQEQGITFGEALESMKSHPEYPKPKRGRPRKEQPQESTSPASTRRRGRPPKGTTWDEGTQSYVTQSGETYQKAEKVTSNRPRGRPPAGKHWDEDSRTYVDNK